MNGRLPPEISGSRLSLKIGLDHPLAKILVTRANKHGPRDLLPYDNIYATLLIATSEGWGLTLSFGMADVISDSVAGPMTLKSTWVPTFLTDASGHAYLIQDNRIAGLDG